MAFPQYECSLLSSVLPAKRSYRPGARLKRRLYSRAVCWSARAWSVCFNCFGIDCQYTITTCLPSLHFLYIYFFMKNSHILLPSVTSFHFLNCCVNFLSFYLYIFFEEISCHWFFSGPWYMMNRTLCLLSSQRVDSCLQDKLWVIQFYLWNAFALASFHPCSLSEGFFKPSPRTRIARIALGTRLPFLSSLCSRILFTDPNRRA